ncbi:pyruvate, phosphate dikinase [Mycobacterium arosiense]|uniref:pyruvate, phosphate dikinase n=1 Tax=Mycobacterium arosiense TaxID=425468 RepID=UPI001FE899DB
MLDGSSRLPREVIGNKGYAINAMCRNGLPVPPAFCITTEVCRRYFADPDHALTDIWDEVLGRMQWLERRTSRTFGTGPSPLLVSVRSGGAVSMPGMLDTVLNLGIDDAVEAALKDVGGPQFAHETRARFTSMYRRIVLNDIDGGVPTDPYAQLRAAIEAVFGSWHSERAVTYRKHHRLGDIAGTAVMVQAMVFGNHGPESGTGVLFSRNPITGTNEHFGEWLRGGQGEDLVAGTVDGASVIALRDEQPAVYQQLIDAARTLERLDGDVQDIEFTVEDGRLWLLQTRVAKRSAQAAVRLALQMRSEGLIDDAETLRRVTPEQIASLLRPSLQPETRLGAPLLANGLPACPGVASGRAYADVNEALDAAASGEDVILVRSYTSPDDVQAMLAASGIVTEVGGATSHAAVISREIGRPTVVGCGAGATAALAGRLVTVDGTEGEVREGILRLETWSQKNSPDLAMLADIACRVSPLRAHATGNYPELQDNSADAVKRAISDGHADVVSPTPLLTMLTALRLSDPNGSSS